MVFKGSLYILNLLCGIIPCEHKFQYPDTSPLDSQQDFNNNHDVSVDYESDNGAGNLYRNLDYNKTHPLVVNTTTGMVQGYWMRVVGGRKIRAFEGIPYAEPPVGFQRFRAPLPIKPWSGLLQANLKGPKCLQYNDIASLNVIGSENCLFLNIYVRAPSQKQNSTRKYPVLIYLHGGGFLTGSGNDFGPSYLLQRDIVLVTINYRVGVLGFMSTNNEEIPGNAGLKDQAEAINWVHNNIESFSGDKEKIILLGHDSGGACVHLHMMSFMARGKFIAGISISGTAFNQWALHTKSQALNLTKALAKAVHCPVHGTIKNMVACLRKQRGFDLTKMQISFLDQWPLTLSLFRPVIEDEYQREEPFITEMPEDAYRKGIVDKIPWICGQAEDEGYTFLLSHVVLGTFGNIRKQWSSLAPDFFNYEDLPIDRDETTRRVNWLYFRHENPTSASIKIYSDALGSRLIYTGIHKALQAHSQHAETYAFMFGYNGKYNLATATGIKSSEWAVGHGEILGYILNSTDMYAGFQKNDTELVLSKILVNLVFNFADKQIPGFTTEGGERYHVWNPVTDARNISFLHIDKKIKMVPEPYLQQILYWESLGLPDSLPLANFSSEIQNITTDPEASKGFVSTDISVTGNTVPDDLVPPIDLNPGTFENDNFTVTFTTTDKYPSLTTSSPLTTSPLAEKTRPYETNNKRSTPATTTSTTPTTTAIATTTITTTKKPKFNRWIAQDFVDFVPMPPDPPQTSKSTPGREQHLHITNAPPTTPTTTSSIANIFSNLIDSGNNYNKNLPLGVSVPILPTKLTELITITKSNLNLLSAANANAMSNMQNMMSSSNENEIMWTASNTNPIKPWKNKLNNNNYQSIICLIKNLCR